MPTTIIIIVIPVEIESETPWRLLPLLLLRQYKESVLIGVFIMCMRTCDCPPAYLPACLSACIGGGRIFVRIEETVSRNMNRPSNSSTENWKKRSVHIKRTQLSHKHKLNHTENIAIKRTY